jgi:hypothetical protein
LTRGRLTLLVAAVALAGCSDSAKERDRPKESAERPIPVIGEGPRYRPPPGGSAVAAARPVRGLRCARVKRKAYGVHLEIFGNRRDLVIPAGIGFAPPRKRDGAYVTDGRCWYPVRTREPTGLIEIDEGIEVTLGDFFDLWGQALSKRRLLSFRVPPGEEVELFVNGKRHHGDPRSLPLNRHAAIVLEAGGFFPPTRSYVFPPGL